MGRPAHTQKLRHDIFAPHAKLSLQLSLCGWARTNHTSFVMSQSATQRMVMCNNRQMKRTYLKLGGFACYQHQDLHLNNLQHTLLLDSFRNDLTIPLSTMSCWVIPQTCSCWMWCRHFSDAGRHTDHVVVAIGTVARKRIGRTPNVPSVHGRRLERSTF